MNLYVQKYLEKKNANRKEDLMKQAFKVMNDLRIGEKEYPENSEYNRDDYPYWDSEKKKYYRYNAGEMSEEELNILLLDSDKEPKFVEKAAKSNWYIFATVMMILGGLAVLITFMMAIIEDYEPNWIPFFVSLISYMFELGFWATVQLLAEIKQGIDNLK